jgi:hypothetical protein
MNETCAWGLDRLADYLEGQLPAPIVAAIEGHAVVAATQAFLEFTTRLRESSVRPPTPCFRRAPVVLLAAARKRGAGGGTVARVGQ